MNSKSIMQLAKRLNEIVIERNNLDVKSIELDKEYNEIVYELWGRIPNLKEDVDMQPKKLVKERK